MGWWRDYRNRSGKRQRRPGNNLVRRWTLLAAVVLVSIAPELAKGQASWQIFRPLVVVKTKCAVVRLSFGPVSQTSSNNQNFATFHNAFSGDNLVLFFDPITPSVRSHGISYGSVLRINYLSPLWGLKAKTFFPAGFDSLEAFVRKSVEVSGRVNPRYYVPVEITCRLPSCVSIVQTNVDLISDRVQWRHERGGRGSQPRSLCFFQGRFAIPKPKQTDESERPCANRQAMLTDRDVFEASKIRSYIPISDGDDYFAYDRGGSPMLFHLLGYAVISFASAATVWSTRRSVVGAAVIWGLALSAVYQAIGWIRL